jgi:preprotein translocase subunit SecD
MQKQRSILALILVLIIAAITVIVTIPTRLGLDLQGGSQLTIQVKTTPTIPKIDQGMLEAVRRIVENRVNGLGVSEALVQTVGEDQILVQLPGVMTRSKQNEFWRHGKARISGTTARNRSTISH